MKLTALLFVTLDGVYQGPGGRDEDRRGGFDRGGWLALRSDEEIGPAISSVYERADAFLLGRRTYDIWERYWPHHDDGSSAASSTRWSCTSTPWCWAVASDCSRSAAQCTT